MNSILVYLILSIILGQYSLVVESCAEDEDEITLYVSTQFFEQSVKSASSYSKTVKSSNSFKKALKKMAVSAEVKAGWGIFTGSAAGSYESLTDSVSRSESNEETIKSEKIEYNTDCLQIIREILTRVTINGRSASSSETKFVDSVPIAESLSGAELTKKAENYMVYLYGPEKVIRNTFTETMCQIQIVAELTKSLANSYQIWNDKGTWSWKDFSCWNPQGSQVLASIPVGGHDEDDGPEQSYTFTGASGVLDSPKDYKRTWKYKNDVSFWEPSCNDGFVALGDYCQTGQEKPSLSAMRCIRKDLTEECGKTKVWNDKGAKNWKKKVRVYKSMDRYVQGMITSKRQAYCLK